MNADKIFNHRGHEGTLRKSQELKAKSQEPGTQHCNAADSIRDHL